MYLSSLLSFFFKQKTAYEIMSGDWSSDVCSSDLGAAGVVSIFSNDFSAISMMKRE